MKKNETVALVIVVAILVFVVPFYFLGASRKRAQEKASSVTSQVFQGPYSKMSLSKVYFSNGSVFVVGDTDLPNGSVFMVTLDVAGRENADLFIGTQVEAIVTNSKFSTFLVVPKREEFQKGPYEVSISFTPRGQSDRVVALVGANGENLVGDLVESSPDRPFRTMSLTEIKELELSVSIPTYSFQQPSEFATGSAEQALANYVLAWKNQDWARMVNYTQKTWANKQGDPAGILQAQYDFMILKGFHDVKVVSGNNVSKDITFIVEYEKSTNVISKKQITARVIKEDGSYSPSESGQWGVNPISMMNETSI